MGTRSNLKFESPPNPRGILALKKERVFRPYSFRILDLIVKLELLNICINLYKNQNLTIAIHYSEIWYSFK